MFNLAFKYHFVFKDIQTTLLLSIIEKYINGATVQISRIDRTRKLFNKSMRSSIDIGDINKTFTQNRLLKLQMDVHFYFICIAQVSKSLIRFSVKLKDKDLYKVKSDFEKLFSREIRNDLEHMDERAIGKKKNKSIGTVRDFYNYDSNSISFNGKIYPVNKEKLTELKNIYKRIISVINKNYAFKDKYFIQDIQREKNIKYLKKHLKNLKLN